MERETNVSIQLEKNYASLIGLIIGIIALMFAIFQDHVALQLEETAKKSRIERTLEKGRAILFDEIPISPERRKKAQLIYMIIGAVGLIFSILAFVKKENLRLSIVASSVCVAAVAWQYVIIALIIFLVIVLFVNFLG